MKQVKITLTQLIAINKVTVSVLSLLSCIAIVISKLWISSLKIGIDLSVSDEECNSLN